MLTRHRTTRILFVLAAALAAGCGGKNYVRGTEVEGLDDPAMSTGLDKRDLQKLLHENMQSMLGFVRAEWTGRPQKPRVAIYPLANETSEHIDSVAQALLSDIESYLVDTRLADVISVERQRQMMAEVDKQHGGGFDPSRIVAYNKQLGAEFYVTGKVYTSDERSREGRRVQYFMYMQLIEVATSAIKWQHKAEVTKALVDVD
jgi:PBP1b-binding outer membrane lipoprotein LpoB